MSFLRHKQRAFTALFPHKGNKRFIIPKKNMGYRELSWSVIPGQQFYTGIPASVDFRDYLRGTNRATATITPGDTYPAGFTFNNGVLSWDGTGNVSPGFEQSCIASDGVGPDTESSLFTVNVNPAFIPLSWDVIPDTEFTYGVPGSVNIRDYLNGTDAPTAPITPDATLPSGFSFNGNSLGYDGTGAPSITVSFTAGGETSNAATFDTDYVDLSWQPLPDWFPVEGGGVQTYDVRSYLQGSNAATAQLFPNVTFPTDGITFDGSVMSYDGSVSADVTSLYFTADDDVLPYNPNHDSERMDILSVQAIDLVTQAFTIADKNGTLDSRDPNYQQAVINLTPPYVVADDGARSISVSRVGNTEGVVGATWTLSGANVADVNPTTGPLSFADGEVTADIDFTVADLAGPGSVDVDLTSPTGGAALGVDSASITLSDSATNFVPADPRYSVVGDPLAGAWSVVDSQNGFGTRPSVGGSTADLIFDMVDYAYELGVKRPNQLAVPEGGLVDQSPAGFPYAGGGTDGQYVTTEDGRRVYGVTFGQNGAPSDKGWWVVGVPSSPSSFPSMYCQWRMKADFWVRTGQPTANSNKYLRVWDTYGGDDVGVRCSFLPNRMSSKFAGGDGGELGGGIETAPNVWGLAEVWMQTSPTERIQYWLDNQSRGLWNPPPQPWPGAGYTDAIVPRGWGMDGSGKASEYMPGQKMWRDGFRLCAGPMRLEIGTSGAGLYSSSAREMQPVTAWSNGLINVGEFFAGQLGSLSGKHLYVVDSNNNATRIGQFT